MNTLMGVFGHRFYLKAVWLVGVALFVSLSVLFLFSNFSLAAGLSDSPVSPTYNTSQSGGSSEIGGVFKVQSVGDLVRALLNVVIIVGTPVAVFFIIYAGFLFVTASGSEEKLRSAKSTLLWAIVGMAILVGAQVINDILQNTVNTVIGG